MQRTSGTEHQEEIMRTRLIGIAVGGALLIGASAAPAINCDQVRRYLAMGRTPESVAETMVVDVNEVKKCAAAEAKTPPTTPKPEASE
jgi:hypothetical protein